MLNDYNMIIKSLISIKEMDIKSKMLAVIYNIRRINQELSENDSLNRHIGYCLGDFIPGRFYSDLNSIAIKSHFRNVHKSFLLNDLSIFYANYLTQLSRDGIDLTLFIKQSLDYLLTGFDIIESLGNFELFKLLVLFHLHIKIIEISTIDSNKISFLRNHTNSCGFLAISGTVFYILNK